MKSKQKSTSSTPTNSANERVVDEHTSELFTLLGLAALSESQKMLIRTELEQLAYKRIMVRILNSVPEEHRNRAIAAVKSGDTATALEQLLLGVQDIQSLVIHEVQRLREELYSSIQQVIQKTATG